MKYVFLAEAEEDLRNAHQFYATRANTLVGDAFAAEVKRVVELIASNPNLGTPLSIKFRAYPMRIFPFKVIYMALDDYVRIMAIAHTSRRPGFWRARG